MTDSIPIIREELSRAWAAHEGEETTRASLFNLLVYVRDQEAKERYYELIQHVVSKFPSRVLFLVCGPRQEADDIHIQVTCQPAGNGELKVYCEMIEIQAQGKYVDRIPFLTLPHLLADLPVFLLWTENPAHHSPLLQELQPFATRIIFDVDDIDSLPGFAHAALGMMHNFQCVVGDLFWNAIRGWRRILAETFSTPERFIILGKAHHLVIRYNTHIPCEHPALETQAAYLQAWLAARLNWNFESFERIEQNVRLSYRRPLHDVVVILQPVQVSFLPEGAIVEMEIESLANQGHYLLSYQETRPAVTVHYSDADQCDCPVSFFLHPSNPGHELVTEIFYPQPHEHYREMLQILSILPWEPPC